MTHDDNQTPTPFDIRRIADDLGVTPEAVLNMSFADLDAQRTRLVAESDQIQAEAEHLGAALADIGDAADLDPAGFAMVAEHMASRRANVDQFVFTALDQTMTDEFLAGYHSAVAWLRMGPPVAEVDRLAHVYDDIVRSGNAPTGAVGVYLDAADFPHLLDHLPDLDIIDGDTIRAATVPAPDGSSTPPIPNQALMWPRSLFCDAFAECAWHTAND